MNKNTQCVWVLDGEAVVGSVQHYANFWERCQGTDVSISEFVWTVSSIGGLDRHPVHVTACGRDENDLLNYTLTIYNVSISAQVDGRA